MSNDPKIKIYKNPSRHKEEDPQEPYTPQYQLRGMEPEIIKSGLISEMHPIVVRPSLNQKDNPRIRQPYANIENSPLGKGPLPNIGNNMEQTWCSIDGDIIDDISNIEISDDKFIDNNEFMTDEALGIPKTNNQVISKNKIESENNDIETSFLTKLGSLAEGDYLLIVNDVILCSGLSEAIQEEAKLLVFGDHHICDGNPIPVDNLIIIKRIPIKIGLFLDE